MAKRWLALSSEVVSALKKRYANLPPIVLARSLERARTEAELFDVLDTVPSEFPICWDSEERRWVSTDLLPIPDRRTKGESGQLPQSG